MLSVKVCKVLRERSRKLPKIRGFSVQHQTKFCLQELLGSVNAKLPSLLSNPSTSSIIDDWGARSLDHSGGFFERGPPSTKPFSVVLRTTDDVESRSGEF